MPSATGSVESARALAARSMTSSMEYGGAARRAATGDAGPSTSRHHSPHFSIAACVSHSAAAYVGRSTTTPPAEPGSVGNPLAEPASARAGPSGPSGTRPPTEVPVSARKRLVAIVGIACTGALRPGEAVNVTEPRLGNVDTDPERTSREKKPSELTRTTREGWSASSTRLELTCQGPRGSIRVKVPDPSPPPPARPAPDTGRVTREGR